MKPITVDDWAGGLTGGKPRETRPGFVFPEWGLELIRFAGQVVYLLLRVQQLVLHRCFVVNERM